MLRVNGAPCATHHRLRHTAALPCVGVEASQVSRSAMAVGLDEGVKALKDQMERLSVLMNQDFNGKAFTRADNMQQYTLAYRMCTQRAPNNFSAQLYDEHGKVRACAKLAWCGGTITVPTAACRAFERTWRGMLCRH